jgi:hypothetical protein
VLDLASFSRDGFAVVPGVIGAGLLSDLTAAVGALMPGGAVLDRGGRVYASRDLLRSVPAVRALAASRGVRGVVEAVLGPKAFAVRGLLFDKSPGANWMVPWHQDLTVAVKARVEAPGFEAWTVKAGVPHVRPPVEVLEKMITLRVHLDVDEPGRGPLRVVPGSHRSGRLGAAETLGWLERVPPVTCLVPRGGALVMRPLLLHASSASDEEAPHHRRVIHLEFASERLPHGVAWSEDSAPATVTAREGSAP